MDGFFGATIESLKQQYPQQFIHEFSLPNRLILMANNTADVIVDDLTALCKAAEKPNGNGYRFSDIPLHKDAIHFMLNRKTLSADFVNAFNRSLVDVLEQNPNLQRNRCEIALSRLKQGQ